MLINLLGTDREDEAGIGEATQGLAASWERTQSHQIRFVLTELHPCALLGPVSIGAVGSSDFPTPPLCHSGAIFCKCAPINTWKGCPIRLA